MTNEELRRRKALEESMKEAKEYHRSYSVPGATITKTPEVMVADVTLQMTQAYDGASYSQNGLDPFTVKVITPVEYSDALPGGSVIKIFGLSQTSNVSGSPAQYNNVDSGTFTVTPLAGGDYVLDFWASLNIDYIVTGALSGTFITRPPISRPTTMSALNGAFGLGNSLGSYYGAADGIATSGAITMGSFNGK